MSTLMVGLDSLFDAWILMLLSYTGDQEGRMLYDSENRMMMTSFINVRILLSIGQTCPK